MGRPLRSAEGGLIYHASNRANGRLTLFETGEEYEAFLRVLTQAVARYRTRLLAYSIMPNHFHLVLWPRADGELSDFMRWLTLTHTQRVHAHRESSGSGHVYQGRFRAFPVQNDEHFVTLCRYVERNAVREGLVERAEQWQWGSLWQWRQKRTSPEETPELTTWPIRRPANWVERVNLAISSAEEEAVQRSLQRGQPFGGLEWQATTAKRLGLDSTMRPRGRPKKSSENPAG